MLYLVSISLLFIIIFSENVDRKSSLTLFLFFKYFFNSFLFLKVIILSFLSAEISDLELKLEFKLITDLESTSSINSFIKSLSSGDFLASY